MVRNKVGLLVSGKVLKSMYNKIYHENHEDYNIEVWERGWRTKLLQIELQNDHVVFSRRKDLGKRLEVEFVFYHNEIVKKWYERTPEKEKALSQEYE